MPQHYLKKELIMMPLTFDENYSCYSGQRTPDCGHDRVGGAAYGGGGLGALNNNDKTQLTTRVKG